MKKFIIPLLLLSLFGSCQTMKPWPKEALLAPRSNPTEGNSESLGFYSGGCLKGAKTFRGNESGLILSQTRRGRFWGHSQLIDVLTELGEFSHKFLKKAVIIGDLSLSRGGPTVGGHSSHQNGLDVDIWFEFAHESTHDFRYWQTEEMKSFLSKERLGEGFGKPQRMMISFLAQDKRVERIFVHPLIKKNLCENRKLFNEESLRKIRPWYGHDDHLHLRLACPESDKSCVRQKAPEAGDGCDKLDWWFSKEVKEEQEKFDFSYEGMKTNYENVRENLPKECRNIYQGIAK
ncbi:MAG: penicillin-insensitive murein endopeptidase [Bacteriovoracaceae bacterium]|nr:penicillin-insensitive murein endopeptidase [Bacteriovoracaceae bacterium]